MPVRNEVRNLRTDRIRQSAYISSFNYLLSMMHCIGYLCEQEEQVHSAIELMFSARSLRTTILTDLYRVLSDRLYPIFIIVIMWVYVKTEEVLRSNSGVLVAMEHGGIQRILEDIIASDGDSTLLV